MNKLKTLYPSPSADFTNGFMAALEHYATHDRVRLFLYGRPIERRALQAEKQRVLDIFTEDEEIIKL